MIYKKYFLPSRTIWLLMFSALNIIVNVHVYGVISVGYLLTYTLIRVLETYIPVVNMTDDNIFHKIIKN